MNSIIYVFLCMLISNLAFLHAGKASIYGQEIYTDIIQKYDFHYIVDIDKDNHFLTLENGVGLTVTSIREKST